MTRPDEMTYAKAGVDTEREEAGLRGFLNWVGKTLNFREGVGAAKLDIGYFANVLDLGHGLGVAVSADSVGTKILVAQMLERYDTIGIDCVAMNVNDVICVGAEPICLLNCLAIQEPNAEILTEIGKGLYEGAKIAQISVPGGETAQLREMITGWRKGHGFDLVGMCLGTVALDKVIVGEKVEEGDVVIGLASSGIHSNGFTLARKVLFEKMSWSPDRYVPELARTVGEELLEPTHIYVPEVMEMLNSGLDIRGIANITGGGLLNLNRLQAETGYMLEFLPDPPPIFELIQRGGQISDGEMYSVFNMGIGFCAVFPEKDVDRALNVCRGHGVKAWKLGCAVRDKDKKITLAQKNLIGKGRAFHPAG